jgi:glucose uptake protein GlcU
VAAAVLFGSQFVLNKFCLDMPACAYNVSMAVGILVGSAASLLVLGWSPIAPGMAALAFAGGAIWVVGNYLFIVAVARAGIARSYVAINFSAVLSFVGGVVFLGELPDLDASRFVLVVGAVVLVMAGSYLVTTTAPQGGAAEARGGSRARQGLVAAFASTVFFAIYNVLTAFVMNEAGTAAGVTFVAVAPGIVCGAVLIALFAPGRALRAWKAAPARRHVLAVLQGLIWAAAMVCILFGWRSVGIALGTSIQVGIQTLVSSLWGILLFGELAGLDNRRAAYLRFAGGAVLTVCGIAAITAV